MKRIIQFCILLFAFCIILTACDNSCEQHVYDDCADTECNVCGETRDSMHSWKDADCLNPKTCTVCGKTEGSALGHEWTTPDVDLCEVRSTCSRCGATDGENKEHTPENDDNDCSTALNCGVCGKEILAAGEHFPENDDGNCTTPITCSVCGKTTTPAKENHTGGTATCTEKAVCTVCNTAYGELAPNNHTSTEFTYTENNDGTHNKLYACCGAVHTANEACLGGEATCMAGAVCEKCDQTYAELDENAHAYEAAVYTWSPDYSTCKATIACSHNEAHSIVETAEAQYDATNDQLFATFENTDFEEVRINYPYTFSEVDGGYSIKKYRGTNKILHIPSTYNGSPIVSLDTQAFRDCDTLVEVVIPEGITVIGETCFYMLDNLKTVHIPASVTTISSKGFNRCYALTDVIFAENSMLTTIGDLAFSECESLVSIVLPKSALNLGSGLFSGCSALTSIVLPEGITALPNSIVSSCDSLVEFNIPTTVTAIGKNAFYYCTNLTVVGGISNVTSIGDGAFGFCSSLKEINLPNCLTSIGEEAFSGCSGLTSIKLPEGITEIKKSTFSYCDSLTEFTIPSTVTSIGNWAFYNCDSLTTITVPKGVTDIGFCAFHMCDNLVSINVEEENERYWSVDGILYGNDSGMVALIQCPNGKAGVVTVQEGTQRIDHFMYCEKITAIIIPDSVTWIQKEAFYACTFESITIPKSLETLGLRSLGQNENLKTVYYGGTTEEWNTLIAKVSTIGISESVVVICSDSESAAQ